MAECIHGLEVPLCDLCYPKTVVEKPKVTRAAAGPRRTAGSSTSTRSIAVGEQRIYHVTHLRNLDSILIAGELRADATPEVDLSSELTRQLRRTAETATGRSVADHVPFFLAPTATLWSDLRGGAADGTRWSAAARAAVSTDFVFLVSTMKELGDDSVIADGDAAASHTRFASGTLMDGMIRRLYTDEAARITAEALVPESFEFDAVQLIGVANDRVRDTVRAKLEAAGFATKVAVYPPWFQPADA